MEEDLREKSIPLSDDTDAESYAKDGGWGWVVLVGCFATNFISDGCAYSFGVLYTELLEYFGETKSKTSWIGSLFFSIPLLCGPVSSIITSKLGCRAATILGGTIAFVGFFTSSFVNSVEALYFTYGFVAGFGMSLPYLTSILIISHYFKKRLAFATGIAECGAGVGTIVFAPVTEALLKLYTWRGTMWVLAALAGNIIVCGVIFRPRSSLKVVNSRVNRTEYKMGVDEGETSFEQGDFTKTCDDTLNLPESANLDLNGDNSRAIEELETAYEERKHDCKDFDCKERIKLTICTHDAGYKFETEMKVSSKSTCCTQVHKQCEHMHSVLELSMFTNPIFLLFVISNFILYFWFDVPYVFLANRSVETGVSESKAALLVSVIGVMHTIGNLVYGFAGDVECLSLPLLYGVSIALCGVSLLVVPLLFNFGALAGAAGMFGLLSAASEALSSILLIEILGEKSLSRSYGFTMMLKGIANLVGPPIAGWLYDQSGSYNNTFYVAGTCLVIAGLMYTPTPIFRRTWGTRATGKHSNRP